MTDLSKDNHRAEENARADMLDFDAALKATGEKIKRTLRTAPPVIRPLTAHLSKAGGKMIRARALLICAAGRDGLISSDAVNAAAGVELLHLATLVHDDIIDNAATRRGIDALHRKFGEKSAVLCGDYLFCVALELASEMRLLENRKDCVDKSMTRYLTEICLGELRQNQNAGNYKITENEYYKIISGKTAALFEASFVTGFLFSDEPDAAKEDYEKIGHTIGVIFQLADDCADYEFTQKRAKKPVLSDYARGVITLPLIHALRSDPALRCRLEAGDRMPPEALKAAVEASGGLEYTHAKIKSLYKKAKALTERLDITEEKRSALLGLLSKAAGL
jgi:geranylgeranyl pyrophosphate synthase